MTTTPDARVAGKPARIHRQDLALAALSGVLLALPFNHASLFLLGWFAFVPMLLALRGKRPYQAYLLGLCGGLVTFTLASWWIVGFIGRLKGYGPELSLPLALLYWFYSAHLLALMLLVLAWLRRRRGLPDLVLFPVLVALFFSGFPMLFQAQLGESQRGFLLAIQGADLTGVSGIDVMVALANVLIFQAVDAWQRKAPTPAGQWWALGLLLVWFGYGAVQLSIWTLRTQAAPAAESTRLGLVQPGTRPLLRPEPPPAGYTLGYPPAMAMSEQLVAAGAELVTWSESRFLLYFENDHVRRAYQRQVAAMATPLVFQDLEFRTRGQRRLEFNTAVLLDAAGGEAGRYHKIKRVAFGEYTPLVEDFPALERLTAGFFGRFTTTVAPGDGPERFATAGLTVIPLICYEAVFPDFVSASVAAVTDNDSPPPLLLTLSNNSWFGDTRQPYQHFNSAVLRAVENRLPLVHVMNDGPSGVVLPDGRVPFQSPLEGEAGYLVTVPNLAGTGETLYNRYPGWFRGFLVSLFALGLLRALVPGRQQDRLP